MKPRLRWWLLLIAIVVFIAGFARLRFDAEVLSLLPGDLPAVRGLKLQQQHFANARDLILTVNAPDALSAETHAAEIARRLRAATNLIARVVWQPPWIERPQEGAELVAHAWLNQPPDVFSNALARLQPERAAAAFAEARERLATSFSPDEIARLSYDPLGLLQLPAGVSAGADFGSGNSLFASNDGTFRLLFVTPRETLRSYPQARAWLGEVEAIMDDLSHSNGFTGTIRRTGGPAFLTEISSGMERDVHNSAVGTLVIVAALFWLAHRRLRPMFWLLGLLALTLIGTLALGGLFLGKLNVISIGFAAILLGLAADYGLVLYQEKRAHPDVEPGTLRRRIAPGIWWSAITTASAFALLNFCGLPGLAQLGTLVALGILLAAVIMLNLFPATPELTKGASSNQAIATNAEQRSRAGSLVYARAVWSVTTLGLVGALIILWNRWPGVDATPEPLRPARSEAYAAMDEIQRRLGRLNDSLWVIVSGTNVAEVSQRLDATDSLLQQLQTASVVESFQLPGALWPKPDRQRANSIAAVQLGDLLPGLRDLAAKSGFEITSLAAAGAIFDTWRRAANSPDVSWPTNDTSRWALEQVSAREPGLAIAAGIIRPVAGADVRDFSRHSQPGVDFAGWSLLGGELWQSIEHRLWPLSLAMTAVMLASLALAFRRWQEVLLSLFSVAVSGLLLLLVMRFAGWAWNLMNLMALPLLLGAGVDYSIHTLLALRRCGSLAAAWQSVGRALLLCAATTIVGFGSLAWSSNSGLASLGKVCATGIACAAVSGIFLLPLWWRAAGGATWSHSEESFSRPSALYRARWWKLALTVARVLPRSWLQAFGVAGATLYRWWNPARLEVVRANLRPVVDSDAAADRAARHLFSEFGRKLADLWRSEAGADIAPLVRPVSGWENFGEALARGRGVLLVTPHLGNWEFGAPLVTRRNVALNVITLTEPGGGFTELRESARHRAGITTHVIGENPFAFVEIIKRLQAGEVVALLMDRPPTASAVRVEFCGRPFDASIAVAELARATGAAILPVAICRSGAEYTAEIFPEITYDRAALNSREARRVLTGQILRAFEPAIRKHPEQWFHFVPIWPS